MNHFNCNVNLINCAFLRKTMYISRNIIQSHKMNIINEIQGFEIFSQQNLRSFQHPMSHWISSKLWINLRSEFWLGRWQYWRYMHQVTCLDRVSCDGTTERTYVVFEERSLVFDTEMYVLQNNLKRMVTLLYILWITFI